MITMVESKEQQKEMLMLCEKTAFGCKISGIVTAYGFDKKFACFWMDTQVQTVYCMLDSVMLISGTITNPQETAAFLRAVGAAEILCAVRNAEALQLKVAKKGEVLKRSRQQEEEIPWQQEEVLIREVFTLLEDTGMQVEFEAFYLDLSHRLRHNAAMVALEYQEDFLAGCAVISSVTNTAAILSAVAVAKNARRTGVGTRLVERLSKSLAARTIYVYKEIGENDEFYKSLGYRKTDTWVSGTI